MRLSTTIPLLAALGVLAAPALATTKGLNQIVTPDVQPYGSLSFSLQQQDPNIGNRYQAQLELGLTRGFEVALFQGASPSEQIGAVEGSLYKKGPYLVSAGFINWSSMGSAPQPFIETGYYSGKYELILGAIRVVTEKQGVGGSVLSNHETQAILGAAYQVQPRVLLQLDYQSGAGNFSTAGFTYNITPNLQVNPSVYLANAAPHPHYGYVVLTYNMKAF